MAMLLDASTLSGAICRSACWPAPSIGVLVTAPARRPTVSGAEMSVTQNAAMAVSEPVMISRNASRLSLRPPCLNDEKNPGPT